MDLRQMEYFAKVCRCNNFTKAAGELHVSQPTVSVAIQKLEEELGVRLLERDNKSIRLTKEGRVFLEEAENILRQIKRLKGVMRDMKPSARKRLKVAFPSTAGSWLWRRVLFQFPLECPEIALEVEDIGTMEIVGRLKAGEIEVGYGVVSRVTDPEIAAQTVREGEIRLLVSSHHPFASLTEVALDMLRDQLLVMYRKGSTYAERRLMRHLGEAGIAPRIQYVNEQSSVFDMVAQDCGVAVVLDERISAIADNPGLACKPFQTPMRFETGLLWSKKAALGEAARGRPHFLLALPVILRASRQITRTLFRERSA